MHTRRSRPALVAAAAVAGAATVLAGAGSAFAHAEVEVDPAQAGARDALISVNPEAHNHAAGAVSVEVYPPEGIAPDDLTLTDGPEGWEFATGEESYTLSGPELDADTSPVHEVRVGQLPDEPVIHFRILLEYGDGQVDRYIEIPTQDDPDPPGAAPSVELAAAAPTTPPAAAPTSAGPTESPTPAAGSEADTDADSVWMYIGAGAAVAAIACAVGYLLARRGARPGPGD